MPCASFRLDDAASTEFAALLDCPAKRIAEPADLLKPRPHGILVALDASGQHVCRIGRETLTLAERTIPLWTRGVWRSAAEAEEDEESSLELDHGR